MAQQRISARGWRIAAAKPWTYELIAIGASAGGLLALTEILRPMPQEMPGIVVVQHLDPSHKSHLAPLLAKKTGKNVKEAEHGESILPGVIYIAPPDEHLLVGVGKIQLAHSQLVHFSRPSIDLMLESVAGMYGSRSIAVILSGSNSDGAMGIRAVHEAGGATMAQEPATAEFRIMPQAAIDTGCVEFIVPIQELGEALVMLCRGERPQS
jgi:two-component system, chemotaxis family, protein-glutamate methylesterase/glutaminase